MVCRSKNRSAFAFDHFHACTLEFMEDLRTPALIDRIGEPGKDRHLVLTMLPEDIPLDPQCFSAEGQARTVRCPAARQNRYTAHGADR